MPAASWMSAAITVAPSEASLCAVASPMPCAAPVTIAIFPFNDIEFSFLTGDVRVGSEPRQGLLARRNLLGTRCSGISAASVAAGPHPAWCTRYEVGAVLGTRFVSVVGGEYKRRQGITEIHEPLSGADRSA